MITVTSKAHNLEQDSSGGGDNAEKPGKDTETHLRSYCNVLHFTGQEIHTVPLKIFANSSAFNTLINTKAIWDLLINT